MSNSIHDPRGFLQHVLQALRQFTRIPVGDAEPGAAASAAMHFPAAGLVLGLASCVVFALVGIGLPDVPAAALAAALACTAIGALLTGAAHEDGLARVAGALAEGEDGTHATRLLDVPGLATGGVLALVFALGGKVALVAAIAQSSPFAVMAVLLAAPVVSRFWPLLLARELPLAAGAPDVQARAPVVALSRPELQLAALWVVVPLVLVALGGGLGLLAVALAVSALALLLVRGWLRSRLPLASGATLGACQQVTELGFYFGAALAVAY